MSDYTVSAALGLDQRQARLRLGYELLGLVCVIHVAPPGRGTKGVEQVKRYTDRERLNYLMSMFSQVLPLQGERPLNRSDVDAMMTHWPSPTACISAMGKQETGKQI